MRTQVPPSRWGDIQAALYMLRKNCVGLGAATYYEPEAPQILQGPGYHPNSRNENFNPRIPFIGSLSHNFERTDGLRFSHADEKKKNQQISSQGPARIEREALHKFFPRTIAVDAQARATEPMEIYTG
jgi:hypothetical protein